MIKIFNPIRLDVARSNDFSVVLAKQGDMNSRFLIVTLCLGGNVISVPKSASVKLNVIRADSVGASFDGTVMDDGRLTIPIDRWICAVAGESRCSVEISHEDQVLTTTKFTVRVEESDDVKDLETPEITPTDPEYDSVLELLEDYRNGRLGTSDIFIRYSEFDDGEGFTEDWSEGQRFIGFACGKAAPEDKSGYIWSLFAGKNGNEVTVVSEKGDSDSAAVSQMLFTSCIGEIDSRFAVKSPENRLDMSAVTEGICLEPDGTVPESPDHGVSDYIGVKAGEVIRFYATRDGEEWAVHDFYAVAAYDENRNILVGLGAEDGNAYHVPMGVSFIRMTLPVGNGYDKCQIAAGDVTAYSEYFSPRFVLCEELHDDVHIKELVSEIFDGVGGSRGIESVTETESGVTEGRWWRRYLISFTDGTSTDFVITDGKDGVGIASVSEGSTPEGIHELLIRLTNGEVYDFRIDDGEDGVGISSINEENPYDGIHDITVTLTSGEKKSFRLRDGVGILSVYEQNSTEGMHDIFLDLSNGEKFNFRVYDGQTPHVGENGNWWLGDTDTGIAARGEKGETNHIQFRCDGEGNVFLSDDHGSISLADDGNGNVNLEVI